MRQYCSKRLTRSIGDCDTEFTTPPRHQARNSKRLTRSIGDCDSNLRSSATCGGSPLRKVDPINRGLRPSLTFVLSSLLRWLRKVDPTNRGLRRAANNPVFRLFSSTLRKVDPINRGLRLGLPRTRRSSGPDSERLTRSIGDCDHAVPCDNTHGLTQLRKVDPTNRGLRQDIPGLPYPLSVASERLTRSIGDCDEGNGGVAPQGPADSERLTRSIGDCDSSVLWRRSS